MYCLDKTKIKKTLADRGYRNLSDFSRRTGMSRQTLVNLLSGKKSVFTHGMDELLKALPVDPFDIVSPQETTGADGPSVSGIVRGIVTAYPHCAVVLIGSRAAGRAKKFSDWDLGVTSGETRLSSRDYLKIKSLAQDLNENGTHGVDVVNLDQAPAWFLRQIGRPRFLGGEARAYSYFMGVLNGIGQTGQTRRGARLS